MVQVCVLCVRLPHRRHPEAQQRVNISMDDETLETLDRLASMAGISRSAMIRMAIGKLERDPHVFLSADSPESPGQPAPVGHS